jgi:hypothetical protein
MSLSEMKISVQLPSCANLIFSRLGSSTTLEPAVGGTILRGDFARYAFPEENVVGHGVLNSQVHYLDLGRKLDITLDGFTPRRSVLLYYDWVTGRYRCVGEQCAVS